MNCARVLFTCPKCESFSQPHTVWITDQKQLLVTAVCVSCEEKFNVVFPLSELFKACPAPDLRKALQAPLTTPAPKELSEDDLTAQDKDFCRELRIKFTAP